MNFFLCDTYSSKQRVSVLMCASRIAKAKRFEDRSEFGPCIECTKWVEQMSDDLVIVPCKECGGLIAMKEDKPRERCPACGEVLK